MLNDVQINFYRENGYLIVKNIFTDEEANRFNQLIRRHANKDFAAIVNPDRYEQLSNQDERPKSDVRVIIDIIQFDVNLSYYMLK